MISRLASSAPVEIRETCGSEASASTNTFSWKRVAAWLWPGSTAVGAIAALDGLRAMVTPPAYLSFQLTERPFRRRSQDRNAAPAAPVAATNGAEIPAAAVAFTSPMGGAAPKPAAEPANAQEESADYFAAEWSHFPQPGEVFAGYELVRELGRSAHGVSFQARQLAPQVVTWKSALEPTTVVVKFLWTPAGLEDERARKAYLERFERRSTDLQSTLGMLIPSAAKVGAAQYIAWNDSVSAPYVIRTYSDGLSLSGLRARYKGGAPLRETATMLTQIAAAVDYAHEHQIVHGALTLENFLISTSGEILVSDFGIHQLLHSGSRLTAPPPTLREARYAAPGRLDIRPLTPAADNYALGVALYALVCGQFPFDGTTVAEVHHARQSGAIIAPNVLRGDLTPEVGNVIVRALTASGKERFATAGDLARAFAATVEQATGAPVEPPTPTGQALLRSLFQIENTVTMLSPFHSTDALGASSSSISSISHEPPASSLSVEHIGALMNSSDATPEPLEMAHTAKVQRVIAPVAPAPEMTTVADRAWSGAMTLSGNEAGSASVVVARPVRQTPNRLGLVLGIVIAVVIVLAAGAGLIYANSDHQPPNTPGAPQATSTSSAPTTSATTTSTAPTATLSGAVNPTATTASAPTETPEATATDTPTATATDTPTATATDAPSATP